MKFADSDIKYNSILDVMIKYMNTNILIINNSFRIIYSSNILGNIFGNEKNRIEGKYVFDVINGIPNEKNIILEAYRTGKPIYDSIETFENYIGIKTTAIISAMPIIENKITVGVIIIVGEANDYKKLSKKIFELQEEGIVTNIDEKYKSNGTIYTMSNIVGKSKSVLELKKKIYKIADSTSPVLVYGETGTGKELIVQTIHNASFKRRKKPFIAQNCAAIPNNLLESILFGTSEGSFTGSKEKKGLFELAEGGTLLLDEINSMDIDLQAKLLRVLQTGVIRPIGSCETKKIDVRIVATTNVDPYKAVELGVIRRDLYYRLNVIDIKVPSLRERKDDLKILCEYYLKYYNERFNREVNRMSDQCYEKFHNYDWPGNIRELKYVIESIMNFIEGDEITLNHLPKKILEFTGRKINENKEERITEKIVDDFIEVKSLKEILTRTEKDIIKKALLKTNGNKAEAARLLEIPRQTFQNKVKKLDIKISYSCK